MVWGPYTHCSYKSGRTAASWQSATLPCVSPATPQYLHAVRSRVISLAQTAWSMYESAAMPRKAAKGISEWWVCDEAVQRYSQSEAILWATRRTAHPTWCNWPLTLRPRRASTWSAKSLDHAGANSVSKEWSDCKREHMFIAWCGHSISWFTLPNIVMTNRFSTQPSLQLDERRAVLNIFSKELNND